MKSPHEGQSATRSRVRPRNFGGEGEGREGKGGEEGRPWHFFFATDVEKSPLNSLPLSYVSFQVSSTCDIAKANRYTHAALR